MVSTKYGFVRWRKNPWSNFLRFKKEKNVVEDVIDSNSIYDPSCENYIEIVNQVLLVNQDSKNTNIIMN